MNLLPLSYDCQPIWGEFYDKLQSTMETLRARTFSLYISLSFLHLSIVSAFSPIDWYLVDCGSSQVSTVDVDNRRFTGDSSEFGSHFLHAAHTISLRDPNPPPSSSPIYHTSRVFTTPSKYAFKIRDKGTHLVRLHFHGFDSSNFNLCDSQFHVLANGNVLLNNYTVMNAQSPRVKDYMIWVDAEELVINFIPSKKSKFAFVNAIEVISAPKDLVPDVATLVTSKKIERMNGLMKNALETVHRVNVGGPKITPFNDSVWRTWIPDDGFLQLSDGSKRVYTSGRIKYQLGGASREVGPDNVYNSGRVISSSNNSVPHLNISWEFPVVEGYNYLVRMHFCDITSISLGLLYFNVYVNGKLAYENLDLTTMTNGVLASPFYADFVVGESSVTLTVSVGPSKMSMPYTSDAILNGVEIMKMNNSMGCLDGEVCAESILRSWPRSSIGPMVPMIAAICLLVIASVVMHRRWVGLKDYVAWSPLPLDISELNMMSGIRLSGKV